VGNTNPRLSVALKATAGEAKGASSITTWQATEKQPSNTDKTEQHLWKANHRATGVAKNGTQPFKLIISSSMTQVVTIAQAI
jgi:hypothetical protein